MEPSESPTSVHASVNSDALLGMFPRDLEQLSQVVQKCFRAIGNSCKETFGKHTFVVKSLTPRTLHRKTSNLNDKADTKNLRQEKQKFTSKG